MYSALTAAILVSCLFRSRKEKLLKISVKNYFWHAQHFGLLLLFGVLFTPKADSMPSHLITAAGLVKFISKKETA